jgi:predicted MFS family arabinose efflux permease
MTLATSSRGYVMTALFLVNVFNLMDRQILSMLLEPIKRDLAVSDTGLGLLTGLAFVSFYTLASVPIARLADARPRRHIIAAALAFWSVMTSLSGLATTFLHLALARVGVGLGEAGTMPASQSMIADLFPRERRPGALALLAAGTPVGLMAAFVLGGWLEQAVGWRLTLVLAGVPGLLLAGLVWLTVDEPLRGGSDPDNPDTALYDLRATLSYLASLPSLRFLTAGAALNVLAGWALLVWSPAFLARVHGLPTAQAGAWLGLAMGLGGAAGSVLCGLAAQRLARGDVRWLLGVPSLTSLLALPFIVLFLTLPSPGEALPMFFGVAFFGPASSGPVTAVIQGLAKVRMRAMAAALVTLAFNAIGVGLGPLVAGALSDRLAPALGVGSLRAALLLTAGLALVGSAVAFALGARRLPVDLKRASLSAAEGTGAA